MEETNHIILGQILRQAEKYIKIEKILEKYRFADSVDPYQVILEIDDIVLSEE